MANVVRLVNGGSIQVRTGVVQGIGPQGPRGVTGPQGPQGEQGPMGEVGPMGQILEMGSKTAVGTNNPITANTDTLIAFGAVAYNEIGCIQDSTTLRFDDPGLFMLNVYLRFDDAAATVREVWFRTGGGDTIARKSAMAGVGAPFYVDLAAQFKALGGETVNVMARSGSATAVGIGGGTVAITRIGSGPKGVKGDQGIQGLQGPIGPNGAAGPPGSASSGFATYDDLKA